MIGNRTKRVIHRLFVGKKGDLDPPSASEKRLEEELRNAFQGGNHDEDAGGFQSEATWKQNVSDLRELVLKGNPREFLRWSIISKTMFVKNDRYVLTELNELRRHPDWVQVWQEAIREDPFGKPIPFNKYPESSGNLIHHAYHLSEMEKKSGIKANSRDFVLEFGGGYGCMCRLFHKMGFHGKYILYDLPQFTALQTYYLKSIGISVYSFNDFSSIDSGVVCISDRGRLKKLLGEHINKERSLFIAMWSISETPLAVRDEIFSMATGFDAYLMAYQEQFGEMDNIAYFENFKEFHEKNIEWQHWRIGHLPGSLYVLGTKPGDHRYGRESDRKTRGKSLGACDDEVAVSGIDSKVAWGDAEIRVQTMSLIAKVKKNTWDFVQDYRHRRGYQRWVNSGEPTPPPHSVKQMTVKAFAKRFGANMFVETGTYLGDMVSAIKNCFQTIYSIELSPDLCNKAKKKFAHFKHVNIVEGDSSRVLGEILKRINEPCLFWLDGHYSKGITAKGEKETPILEELRAILKHPVQNHIILIDDARCFTGENEYPTIATLKKLIVSKYPDYVFTVESDIIRIHPNDTPKA
jgi:hypothetical protein